MNICFYGVGGVGGYFGGIVADKHLKEHNIYFIARGKHKDAIIKDGIIVKKDGGDEIIKVKPTLCTDNPEDLPVCDIVIVSVKSYDLSSVSKELNKITNENSIVLPLLNGIDIYERIRESYTEGYVLPACVYVGTHIESPGVIFQKGGSCKISLGNDPGHPEFKPHKLLDLLQTSEIQFEWSTDVYKEIWSKFIFIASFGLVGATYDKTLGEIIDNKELSRTTRLIMSEIENISNKKEIGLSENIVQFSFQKGFQFPYSVKTSFHRDVEAKGNINEGDLFGGTIIRLGKKLNADTNITETVYSDFLRNQKALISED